MSGVSRVVLARGIVAAFERGLLYMLLLGYVGDAQVGKVLATTWKRHFRRHEGERMSVIEGRIGIAL